MSPEARTAGAGAPGPLPDAAVGPSPAPGRVDQLAEGLVRLTAPNPGLMTGPGTNTYLVGAGELAVVDPGPDDAGHREAILAEVARRGAAVRWVLVTHTHLDHAPGAAPLAAVTGAEVIGFGPAEDFAPDRAVGDDWVLAGGGWHLRAVHTPGHASNHLCWLWEEGGILLSGDHVMEGSTVVINPPDGDMAAYLASLERLLTLDPPLVGVAPGHGRLIADPATVVRGVIDHRLARERQVAQALAARGTASIDDLLPVVYADVAEALLPVARRSLWAHLRKLAADGRARSPGAPLTLGEPDGAVPDGAVPDGAEPGGAWEAVGGPPGP